MRWLNEMHFDAQPQAAKLYKATLLIVAIISYIVAFMFQRFSYCVYSILAVTILSVIFIIPGQWPWWQRPMPQFAKDKSN